MPLLPASELEEDPYLKLLVMGAPKSGKSSMCVSTAPGPVAIILCEDDSALKGPRRHSPEGHWSFVRCRSVKDPWGDMQKALVAVSDAAKAGEIATVVVDPLSDFAKRLEEQCLDSTNNDEGKPDGRRAYPIFNRRVRHFLNQLFAIKAHIIVITHYMETGGQLIDNQLEKTGVGIVPLIGGQARALVAAVFSDVIWMEIRNNQRVFLTGPQGAWGPGCRNSPGAKVIPADIGALLKLFQEESNKPFKEDKKEDKKEGSPPAVVKPSNSNSTHSARPAARPPQQQPAKR